MGDDRARIGSKVLHEIYEEIVADLVEKLKKNIADSTAIKNDLFSSTD